MRPLLIVACLALIACPKKTAPPEPAPEPGWHAVGEIQCYRPPDFEAMTNHMTRKETRQTTWSELYEGLSGQREGAPAMATDPLEALELVLLGYPERIESFAGDAYTRCNAAADAGTDAYVAWLNGAAARLSASDCNRPFVFEVHDELKVQTGWQQRYHMCEGDRVRIELPAGTQLFSVYDTGDQETTRWHGVLGDPANPVTPEVPCADCRAGEVLIRFEHDDGGSSVERLIPIDGELADAYDAASDTHGFKVEFVAPGHGHVSFGFNDTTYYDNVLYEDPEKGYTEYIPIDIYPVVGDGDMYLGD